MFDHLGIVVADLASRRAFYSAVLEPLAYRELEDHTQRDGTGWIVYGTGAHESPFFVIAAGQPSFWRDRHFAGSSPIHLAFRAPSRAAVDRFHASGIARGAANNGEPGVRRGRYYCAFLIDPDGNNIEAGVYADG